MGFGHIERFSGSSRQFLSCKEYLEMNSSSKLLYSLLAFVFLSSSSLSFLAFLSYGDLFSSLFWYLLKCIFTATNDELFCLNIHSRQDLKMKKKLH